VTTAREIMAVDDSLWLPFRHAKDTLFAALLHPPQPCCPFVERDGIRTATNEWISALEEVECELETLQQEIRTVRQSISRRRAVARNSMMPVTLLLSELFGKLWPLQS
jgi:hypothetical protein